MSVLVSLLFFIVSIFAIAQSAITLKTYADTKKPQDTNYKFSIFMLVASVLGLLISGFMIYRSGKGKGNGNGNGNGTVSEASNVINSQTGLANQLENVAANAQLRATKAAEGAKLANALGATLGALKKKM